MTHNTTYIEVRKEHTAILLTGLGNVNLYVQGQMRRVEVC